MPDSSTVGPRTNAVLGVGVVLLAGVGWLAADTLPSGLRVDPLGPAYYPRFVFLSLAVLGLALLVDSLRALRSSRALAPTPRADDEALPAVSYRRLAGVLGLSLVYVLVLTPLGYVISTLLFVAALLPLLRVRNVAAIVGCAIGTPLVLGALFDRLLGVPLPGGVLDILVR